MSVYLLFQSGPPYDGGDTHYGTYDSLEAAQAHAKILVDRYGKTWGLEPLGASWSAGTEYDMGDSVNGDWYIERAEPMSLRAVLDNEREQQIQDAERARLQRVRQWIK